MLDTSCSFHLLNKTVIDECKSFTCGNDDLNDFFKNEAENYTKQLIAKSYCFRLKTNLSVMICAFTLSNSKIKVKGLKKTEENNSKHTSRKNSGGVSGCFNREIRSR
jgi:hypothetical protein